MSPPLCTGIRLLCCRRTQRKSSAPSPPSPPKQRPFLIQFKRTSPSTRTGTTERRAEQAGDFLKLVFFPPQRQLLPELQVTSVGAAWGRSQVPSVVLSCWVCCCRLCTSLSGSRCCAVCTVPAGKGVDFLSKSWSGPSL